jgi:uncharacterized integral membrane protein
MRPFLFLPTSISVMLALIAGLMLITSAIKTAVRRYRWRHHRQRHYRSKIEI